MLIQIAIQIPQSLENILLPGAVVLGIAVLLGILIVIVSHFFQLPVNEKKEELLAAMPGANCGGCGFAGCDGYAQFLADGATNTALCTVGGAACSIELASILGIDASFAEPRIVRLLCQGTTDNTHRRYEYLGTQTCNAAHGLLGGPGACTYGCLGFGDCITVCAFGALSKIDGIIQVDPNECTACGQCVTMCPKDLLQLHPISAEVTVRCKNTWPGAQTKKNCSVGCIGCQKCAKVCPVGAITMSGPLAVVNQDICTRCGACVPVCPTKSIVFLEKSID
jgi:electron transport complex protein RnfB